MGNQPGFINNTANPPEYYCQSSQPLWSTFRDGASFGFGGITFVNDTYAVFNMVRGAPRGSSLAWAVALLPLFSTLSAHDRLH